MSKQQQFLNVVDRDEAERRFQAAISLQPLGTESVALDECRGRILAEDIIATVDVPSFDRSNYDGFAVRANDTVGATEERPVTLQLLGHRDCSWRRPRRERVSGQRHDNCYRRDVASWCKCGSHG